MKKLSLKAFEEIRLFVMRNARPLDFAMWRRMFENESEQAVLSALSAYQNSDGGFGYGIECDNWNPNSNPTAVERAIWYLDVSGAIKQESAVRDGIVKYLNLLENHDGDGWHFTVKSNNDYPHAPWWTYSDGVSAYENIGVTAHLSAFAFQFAKGTLAYDAALDDVRMLSKRIDDESLGDMGIDGYLSLVALGNKEILPYSQKIFNRASAAIVTNPEEWKNYGVRPSNYIRSPESPLYKGNEKIVDLELDYLIDTRHEGGVWDITWTWYDNMDKYGNEFRIAENWWKSVKAIENLLFLNAFGRLEK